MNSGLTSYERQEQLPRIVDDRARRLLARDDAVTVPVRFNTNVFGGAGDVLAAKVTLMTAVVAPGATTNTRLGGGCWS
jgi:hypothetical protein